MKPAPSATSLLLLLILPISLLAVTFIVVVYHNDHYLQTLATSCLSSSPSIPGTTTSYAKHFTGIADPAALRPEFRLLIGILTLPDRYERRHLLRMVYALQSQSIPPWVHIDIKYVFCNLTKPEHPTLIALEILAHDDIIVLNCAENMNDGKTFHYFSSLPSILDSTGGRPPYDYVMKADDDIYLRLPRLAESFRRLPREDLYYGFVIPCDSMDPWHWFMYGAGYGLSWDLVEWIATAEIPRREPGGPSEDLMVGKWLREGEKAKNRFNNKPAMYDYPVPVKINNCSHEFVPDTIGVHRLKDVLKWTSTLDYFNVTAGLKPSRLYHLS